jgi:hypothetical protein
LGNRLGHGIVVAMESSTAVASLTHLPADTDPAVVVEVLHRDAAVVIDDMASPAQLEALRAELEPHFDATPPGEIDFHGTDTRRVGALIARSPACRTLATNPLVVGTAEQLGDAAVQRQWLPLLQEAARALRPLL